VTRSGFPNPILEAVSCACTNADESEERPGEEGRGWVDRMGIALVSVRCVVMGPWASLAKWDWSGSALGLWGAEEEEEMVLAVGVVDMVACDPSFFLIMGKREAVLWRCAKNAKGERERERGRVGFRRVSFSFPVWVVWCLFGKEVMLVRGFRRCSSVESITSRR